MNPKNSSIPLESNTALVAYPFNSIPQASNLRALKASPTSRTRHLSSCKVLV